MAIIRSKTELRFSLFKSISIFLGIAIAFPVGAESEKTIESNYQLITNAIAGLTASMTIVLADTWEIRTLGKIDPIVPQTEQLSLGATRECECCRSASARSPLLRKLPMEIRESFNRWERKL
ncbi:hypothetical protein IQ238_25460 [Pleurocapsales cyanobacterium LEGE 06147]|nr:hypothetical protein [Pleurocapsales cyanobacterium LEGE 06147]